MDAAVGTGMVVAIDATTMADWSSVATGTVWVVGGEGEAVINGLAIDIFMMADIDDVDD